MSSGRWFVRTSLSYLANIFLEAPSRRSGKTSAVRHTWVSPELQPLPRQGLG